MIRQSAWVLLLVAAPAAAALTASDSPALSQANQLTPLTSEFVYDNAAGKTDSVATPFILAQASTQRCPAGGCDLRRGGPAPQAMKEPANPLEQLKKEESEKKNKSEGGFSWKSPLVLVGGGALLGGLAGYFMKGTVLGYALKGGLMGGLIGAVIGAAIGFIALKMFA